MSSNRGHRAGQCAPEGPRTRIRARGDLQEGHVYGTRLCGYASRCQFPLFPSTKSGFLCAFSLWNPRFQAFRAQKQHFCARGSLFRGGARDGLLWDSARGVLLLLGSCCSGCGAVYLLAARRAKSSFLKVAASLKSSACMPAAMAPSTLAGLSSVKRHSEALSPNFWQSRS